MDAIDNYLEEQLDVEGSNVENLEEFYNQCEVVFFQKNDNHAVWTALMSALSETEFEVQKKFWDKFLKMREFYP